MGDIFNFCLLGIFLTQSIFFSAKVTAQSSGTGLIINEIMHSPTSPEPEWIEIYNCSQDSINLNGFAFDDNKNNPQTIILNEYYIHSEEYLILSRNLQVADNYSYSFNYICPKWPLFTNEDEVKLFNASGELIDSVSYSSSWGGKSGKSMERISFDGDSNNKNNWGTSIAGEGATPGKYNSISPKDYDLAVTDIGFTPMVGIEDSVVIVRAYISNLGKKTADNFYVVIMNGQDILSEENFYNFQPGDGTTVFAEIKNLQLGEFIIECYLGFSSDMNYVNNSLSKKLTVLPKVYSYNDLVINEIMFEPYDDEPEWFEVVNTSNKKINLSGWTIADEYRSIKLPDTSFYLLPSEYLVISAKDNLESFYEEIPARILKVNLPSLNNLSDVVALYDHYHNKIDSVHYSKKWGGGKTFSLERISYNSDSNDSLNWQTCFSKTRGTPGKTNSLSYKLFDIELARLETDSSYVILGNSLAINATVVNKGRNKPADFQLTLFHDRNNNSLYETEEIIINQNYAFSSAEDSLKIRLVFDGLLPGKNNFQVVISEEMDEETENNSLTLSVDCIELRMNPGDIIVNEIMFAPVGNEEEWIELFNTTNKYISLRGIFICDNRSDFRWNKDNQKIKAKNFLVITRSFDSMEKYGKSGDFIECNFPSLNNNGDCVIIKDSLGRTITRLEYNSAWGGGNGKSLERVSTDTQANDSLNWKSSNSEIGATPWRTNSVSQKDYDIKIEKLITNPEQPKPGDELSFMVQIKNIGKISSTTKIEIYETAQGKIKQIYSGGIIQLIPGEGKDIHISKYLKCTGVHDLTVECSSENDEEPRNNKISQKIYPSIENSMLLINEIMYQPINGEPEWIELYNNSDFEIPLEGLVISDILSTPARTELKSSQKISPRSYCVISKDKSLSTHHDNVPNMIINSFANLNNTLDGVVVTDYYNHMIDSVFYGSRFKSKEGYSLERISTDVLSNDSLNWMSSEDSERSTPGIINSMTNCGVDLSIKLLNCFPLNPVVGEKISLEIQVENLGLFDCPRGTINIYTINENKELLKSLPTEIIKRKEIKCYNCCELIVLERNTEFFAEVISSSDTLLSNNSINFSIKVGPPRGSILINEFMSNAAEGQDEWIEIFNSSNYEIDLGGWFITDNSKSAKKTFCEKGCTLYPGEYFVICKDTSLRSTLIKEGIKCDVVDFASLNNTSEDEIIIYDSRGFTIDSLFYDSSWNIEKGFSKEKIVSRENSCYKNNWSTSISINGGTPGRINSVSGLIPVEINSLVINEIMFNPSSTNCDYLEILNVSDESIELASCFLMINGNQIPLNNYQLYLHPQEYFIISRDSSVLNNYPKIIDDWKINITSNSSFSLTNTKLEITLKDIFNNVIDSVYYDVSGISSDYYKNRSLERINSQDYSCDCQNWYPSVNNRGGTPGETNSVTELQNINANSLVINEIMFDPSADNSEFIEIHNKSSENIELSGCYVRVGKYSYELTNSLTNLSPGDYFVFASDSSLVNNYSWLSTESKCFIHGNSGFSLPNTSGEIAIFDHWNNKIDSVHYENTFHNPNLVTNKNTSLERINTGLSALDNSNWNSSVDLWGATPGKKNSIHIEVVKSDTKFEINPNPFSPDNDGFEDFTIISYNLPKVISRYRLRIFDREGRLVKTLVNNELTGSSGEVIFNGLDESGRALRIGIYIALFEASDPFSGYQEIIKKPFVVARKL